MKVTFRGLGKGSQEDERQGGGVEGVNFGEFKGVLVEGHRGGGEE